MEKVHIVRKESSRGGGWGAVREGGMSQGLGGGGRGGGGRAGASQTSESSQRSGAGGACGGGRNAGWSNEMHLADAADALSDFGSGISGGGRKEAGSLRMNKAWSSSSSSRQGRVGADGGSGRRDETGRRVQQQQQQQHPLRRMLWTVALFQDSSLSLTLPTACHFLVGSCRKHAGDLTPPLFVSMPPRSWSKPHTPFARDKSCERISPTDSSTSSSPNREL